MCSINIPSYGWDSDNANNESYSIFNQKIKSNNGYEEITSEQNPEGEELRKTANRNKVLGYIPIIGSIIGYQRLKSMKNVDTETLSNKNFHLLRGTIELLSLGILNALADLIVTVARAAMAFLSNALANLIVTVARAATAFLSTVKPSGDKDKPSDNIIAPPEVPNLENIT